MDKQDKKLKPGERRELIIETCRNVSLTKLSTFSQKSEQSILNHMCTY